MTAFLRTKVEVMCPSTYTVALSHHSISAVPLISLPDTKDLDGVSPCSVLFCQPQQFSSSCFAMIPCES